MPLCLLVLLLLRVAEDTAWAMYWVVVQYDASPALLRIYELSDAAFGAVVVVGTYLCDVRDELFALCGGQFESN
jgi:hypothetical protein